MNRLVVSKLKLDFEKFSYFSLQKQLEKVSWNNLAHVNWPTEFPYRPEVSFQIVHDCQHIVLHYVIAEEYVKAQYVRPNEAVWEDSCVEFFISFDGCNTYYNIEFNVLGTGLIGYGTQDKSKRARLSAEVIERVQTATSVVNDKGKKQWSIILAIPLSVFENENSSSLSGLSVHGNFYKCGDKLPTPHFISWNKIEFPTPNFHLPQFFGHLEFE